MSHPHDDDRFAATGKEIGRIDLGHGWALVAKDDGDPDAYTDVMVEDDDGNMSAPDAGLWEYRKQNGDGALRDAFRDDAGGGGAAIGSRDSRPAFACDDCHETWPRGSNQNPGDGPDYCPNCGGDDD